MVDPQIDPGDQLPGQPMYVHLRKGGGENVRFPGTLPRLHAKFMPKHWGHNPTRGARLQAKKSEHVTFLEAGASPEPTRIAG